MQEIMDYDRWMKFTYGGKTARRSSDLKAVDKALKAYHQSKTAAQKQAALDALEKWIASKGSGWKDSVRNRFHAVEDLQRQLKDVPVPNKSAAEMLALSTIQNEARAIVFDLFHNQSLTWREDVPSRLGAQKFAIASNSKKAARNVKTLTGVKRDNRSAASRAAADLIDEVVPDELRNQVTRALDAVIPGFMRELAKSMTPFIGVITTGAGAANDIRVAFKREWDIHKTQVHRDRSMAAVEGIAAIEAMIQMLERERNYAAFNGSVGLAETGGKLAGVLMDGGTATNAAVGLASALIKLLNILRIVIRDVSERNAADVAMAKPGNIDHRIFEVNPVLGAYYVCCVPTSVLVSDVFERFSTHGWRGDVERTVKRHIEPLREQGRTLIKSHRFVIAELSRHPGVLARNETELRAMEDQQRLAAQ